MTIIKINDTELYYEEFGSGIPFLVMQGGLGLDYTYLRPTFDSLGDIFKLIFHDYRGHGRSGRPEVKTITYEQIAQDAYELRECLGYSKIGIIGHSAGGFIALNYAINYPNFIKYLILIDTAPAFDYMEEMMTCVMQKNPTPEMIEALDAPVDLTIEGFRKQFKILNPLYFHDFNPEIENITTEIIDKMILSPEAANCNDLLMSKYNVSSQISKIEVPTLILTGKHDFICPPSQAQRMHENIPNSEMYIFEKCGHYPFWEVREEFFGVIRDWFKRVFL